MNQQPSPVRDYRRGFEQKDGRMQWQKLWHFNEKCTGYPTGTFELRKIRPPDNVLCIECRSASFA